MKYLPQKVTKIETIMGASSATKLLPPYNSIPDEFTGQFNPWVRLADQWFFKGLKDVTLVPVESIDRAEAIGHLAAIMGSFEPKHEHKIAGVAYLLSLWFQPLPVKEKASP